MDVNAHVDSDWALTLTKEAVASSFTAKLQSEQRIVSRLVFEYSTSAREPRILASYDFYCGMFATIELYNDYHRIRMLFMGRVPCSSLYVPTLVLMCKLPSDRWNRGIRTF